MPINNQSISFLQGTIVLYQSRKQVGIKKNDDC